MTKKGCDWLSRKLYNFGAMAIHGDKTQQDRDWTLNQFKSGRSDILVATDVAARGLDIKNVQLVINFDFPLNIEDYVHRIGRTGRAGKYGVSHSFFCKDDLKTAARSAFELAKIMDKAQQNVSEELRELAHRGSRKGGSASQRY